jgi:hypothetical protein
MEHFANPSTKEAEMRFSGAEAQEKSQPKEDAFKLLTKSLETLILPITAAAARMEAAAVTMATLNSTNRQTVGLDPALNRRASSSSPGTQFEPLARCQHFSGASISLVPEPFRRHFSGVRAFLVPAFCRCSVLQSTAENRRRAWKVYKAATALRSISLAAPLAVTGGAFLMRWGGRLPISQFIESDCRSSQRSELQSCGRGRAPSPFLRPLVHRLRLHQLPLIRIEDAQVVDRVQRRRMVGPQRLLVPRQSSLVHRLRLR